MTLTRITEVLVTPKLSVAGWNDYCTLMTDLWMRVMSTS